jgi:hypothetical protein
MLTEMGGVTFAILGEVSLAVDSNQKSEINLNHFCDDINQFDCFGMMLIADKFS